MRSQRIVGKTKGIAVAAALCTAFLCLCFGAPGAAANLTHPFEFEFDTGPTCEAKSIAVDETIGAIYVMCDGISNYNEQQISIRKFHLDGTPFPLTASGPYISGNAITGTPDPAVSNPKIGDYYFGCPCDIAVDNSNSANKGHLYVSSESGQGVGESAVDVFEPSGKWIAGIPSPGFGQPPTGVDIARDGTPYIASGGVDKFDAAFHLIEEVHPGGSGVAVDNTGAVYTARSGAIYKFEADQFSTNLHTNFETKFEDETPAQPSPYAPVPLIPTGNYQEGALQPSAWETDPITDELYVDFIEKGIRVFSPGNAQEPAHQIGLPFGETELAGGSYGITVTETGFVYATTRQGKVFVFGKGQQLPSTRTFAPRIPDVGHDAATVRGHVDLEGGGPIVECNLEWGLNVDENKPPEYNKPPLPCSPDPSGQNFIGPTDVSATLPSELVLGKKYHYRFVAGNADGLGLGADRVVSPAAVLDVETKAASDLTTNSATLNGSLDPDSMATSYHFEYGLTTAYHQRTESLSAGAGAGDSPVSVPISTLATGLTYHFRLVAENSLGTTAGPDLTFTTGALPKIGTLQATDLSATGATLHARISPAGYDTTYHFEYGPSVAYGATAPIPSADMGSGSEPQDVSVPVTGLQPGATYHYRVVATNQWGTSTSDDTSFNFAPPSCPNEHVRQQTASNYLPDCRAYELVSPEEAGTVKIFPSDEIEDIGGEFLSGFHEFYPVAQWVQNTGLATSPSRFMFVGSLGTVTGLDAPNATLDNYLATRTNHGWVTTLPGLTGSEAISVGRHDCNRDLSLCLDHKGMDFLTNAGEENAPFVFRADGEKIGRLPTNVNVVPEGGTNFYGDQQMSGDFSKFVFSSTNVPFTEDGTIGSPGSAYINDIKGRTVKLISRLQNGEDIPHGEGSPQNEVIAFPPGGVSLDGSHVVMSTIGPFKQENLYLYAHGVTKPLANGFGAVFAGMTDDGSKIFFTSKGRVTAEDTDTSTDLYVWRDATEEIELVSKGNGIGNTDECDSDWSFKCGVQLLETDRGDRNSGFYFPEWAHDLRLPGIDSKIARDAGDVYYYSPENLDPNSPGVPGERNLYVFHKGQNQLVATLDPGTTIRRIQISPDGAHSAFITAARLTGYDNAGHREMYTYNAETGVIRCASCNPSGVKPFASVIGSQGGPFMSDDGRAFFATREPLVPQDTDGVIDVYEFVNGRPQLITTGTQARDNTESGSTQLIFVAENTGLESVSANGTDVYFTTFDTLVPQDQNGSFVKVYDARTDGGFEPPPPLAPCVAADECHGESSSSAVTPQLPSNAALGSGGNVAPSAKQRARKHRVNRHRKRRKAHRKSRSHRG